MEGSNKSGGNKKTISLISLRVYKCVNNFIVAHNLVFECLITASSGRSTADIYITFKISKLLYLIQLTANTKSL